MKRRDQEHLIAGMIRALGTSLKNRGLYPASHPLVRTPVEKVHKDLLFFFADHAELVLVITDGTLVFEGVPIFSLTSSLESFMERLARIGLPAIIFEKGITPGDIDTFVRFLHETKEQGLSSSRIQKLLDQAGVTHIRVKPIEEDEENDQDVAHEIYDNAVSVVVSALRDVRLGRIPSGAESERVAKDISGMITRNRDAMLALTLIKNYDEYTYNHSVNVAVLSLALADALKLSSQDKVDVGVAGLLHDIGKTQLALDLIRKPSTLTPEEFEEIMKHPEEGFALLGKMSHIRSASAYMVREHHMRFDRTGYPRPEPGYSLHPNSNIIPVADCYDALTTMRSYQRARYPLQALEVMTSIAGKSLDPEMMEVFTKTMGAYPVGTMVRLSTMEIGVVSGQGAPGCESQKVVVLFDRNGDPLPRPEQVDLGETDDAKKPRRTILGTVNPQFHPSASTGALFSAMSPALA
ncbi:MAG TPA: HD domain-containing phosphohydrolase [Candidatus Limnocylindrales bacterium]|nr:HD domain-containing phosphohydrolase [Candidatus Limnocylindrales bacterium]